MTDQHQQYIASTKFDIQNETAMFYTDPLRYMRWKQFCYATMKLAVETMGVDMKDISMGNLEHTYNVIIKMARTSVGHINQDDVNLHQTNQSLQHQLEDAKRALDNLQKQSITSAKSNQNVHSQTDQVDQQLLNKPTQLEQQLQDLKRQLQQEQDNNNKALQESKSQVDNLTKQLQDIKTENDALRGQLHGTYPDIDRLTEKYKKENEELQRTNDTLTSMFHELSETYQGLEAKIDKLDAKKSELERLLEEAKKGLPYVKMDEAAIRAKHSKLSDRIQELRGKYELHDPCRLKDIAQVMSNIERKTKELSELSLDE